MTCENCGQDHGPPTPDEEKIAALFDKFQDAAVNEDAVTVFGALVHMMAHGISIAVEPHMEVSFIEGMANDVYQRIDQYRDAATEEDSIGETAGRA